MAYTPETFSEKKISNYPQYTVDTCIYRLIMKPIIYIIKGIFVLEENSLIMIVIHINKRGRKATIL